MSTRSIAVEEFGTDYHQPAPKSLIRLKGKWLQLAGFPPGTRTKVTVLSPGLIELRLVDEGESQADREFRLSIQARLERAMNA